MGQVTNVLPTRLSAVKAALGTSSPNNLRAYLTAGTAGVPSGTAGHLGFIPTSGTVRLAEFRDATRVNYTANKIWSAEAMSYGFGASSVSMTVTYSNAGVFSVSTSASGDDITASNETLTNEWLLRNNSSCLANTCSNWEIRVTKTGGTYSAPSNNNAWVSLGTSRTISIGASATGGSGESWNLICNVSIRRADTGTIMAARNVTLSVQATSSPDDPP